MRLAGRGIHGAAASKTLPRARSAFLWLAALTLPASTLAQEQVVDLMLLYTSDDAAHFGEYSDLNDDGARLVGAIDLSGEPTWSPGDGGEWSVVGRNLGLDTYEAAFTIGQQGLYELSLTFDGYKQFKRDDGRTPYVGSTELSLPDSWVAGPTTGDMASLATTTRGFDQDRERDVIALDTHYLFDELWSVDLSYRYQDVDGTQVEGGAIYFDQSTSFSALLPSPVDYETQDFSASLAYGGERFNSVLSYLYTDFDKDESLLIWDNAYSGIGSVDVGYPNGQGAMSLAPDHHRNQVRTSGSYLPPFKLLQGLSLQWDGAWDRVEQDDTFNPYTVNPALTVDTPLPRSDLDGELETWTADVRATYRPRWKKLRKLTLRGGYHYDDRDYDRPRDAYQYVRGDGSDQPDAISSIYANSYDTRREGFDVAGDYRLPWMRGKLTLEYDYLELDRRNAAVDKTETDTYRAVVRLAPLDNLTTRLEYSFEDVSADDYQVDESFFSRRTSEFISLTPDDQRFDNHPLLSQYHLSNSETDTVHFDLGYTGIDNWYLSANVQWNDIGYDQSIFGLTDAKTWFYGLDAQYSPSERLSLYGYASYSKHETDSGGRSFGGGAEKPANRTVPPLPQGSDPRRDWSVATEDEAYTAGLGLDWTYSEKLELKAQFVYVDTTSENDFGSGGAADLDTSSVPDINSTLYHFTLSADYQIRDDAIVTLHYQYYDYDEDDWALQGVGLTTIDDVLTLGEQPDDEDVNLIGFSVRYKF